MCVCTLHVYKLMHLMAQWFMMLGCQSRSMGATNL